MKFDRLHDLKGLPPIPAKHDEKAALIRHAIRELAGLLEGGAAITYQIDQAEAYAAQHPRKRHLNLSRINAERYTAEGLQTLHRVAANLKLANIAAADPGKLDEARLTRDLAFIRAAFTRHHEDGNVEVDHPSDPRHAPAFVSAADDLEEAGGAYVQAWVWVPLEDVDSGHLEDAAADLAPKKAS